MERRLVCCGALSDPRPRRGVLGPLCSLRSLELEKPGYEERELEALGALPSLTRLVLAGGYVGSGAQLVLHVRARRAAGVAVGPVVRLQKAEQRMVLHARGVGGALVLTGQGRLAREARCRAR